MIKLLKTTDKFENGKFQGREVQSVINIGETKYLNYFLSRNKEYRLHRDVLSLVQSKVKLNMNGLFVSVLRSINTDISNKLLELNNSDGVKSIFTNIKSFKKLKDSVVFDTPFGNKKNEIKVGRLVRKLLEMNQVQFTDHDIERFVADYSSNISSEIAGAYFKLVSGDEIKWCYNVFNYHKTSGTLGNSCARHPDYGYRLDLYSRNPEEVKLLVLLDRETNKVMGRSVIWQKSKIVDYNNPNNKFEGKFMDRIYTTGDRYMNAFKSWAKDNGVAFKEFQSYNHKFPVVVNGSKFAGNIVVELSNTNVNTPYLDTVSYIKSNTKLCNNPNFTDWDHI